MAKRFSCVGPSMYNYQYEVNIYDDDYTGSVLPITLSPDIIFESHGNDRDHNEIITTGSATITVLMIGENEEDLIDDILAADEGRFYLELKHNQFKVFFGRIMSNGISIQDEVQPAVTLQAIDGLTLLKDTDYVHPDVNQFVSIKDIFVYILNQVDVIDKYYVATDGIIYMASKLEVNDPTFSGSVIYEIIKHNDYFYTLENNTRVPLSCWDVLEELLKRYNMRLVYSFGLYKILGKEIYLSSNTLQQTLYRKNGTGITPIITFPVIDILGNDTRALAGGTYYFEPGVKKVTIVTDKNYVNKNLADGKWWYQDDDTYQTLGFMNKDKRYQSLLTFSVYNFFLPSDYPEVKWVRVRMFFKAQEFEGSDIKYPKMSFEVAAGTEAHFYVVAPSYPLIELENATTETPIVIYFRNIPNLQYALNFIFPEFTDDRVMSYRIEYDGLYDDYPDQPFFPWEDNLITDWELIPLTYTVKQEFGQYPVLQSDVVKFSASTDSTEVFTKEIKIIAPDKYGQELTRPILSKAGVGHNRSDDNWSFDSSDPEEALERAICRNILKYTASKQKFLDISLSILSLIPEPSVNITYRGEDFFVSKINWSIYNATMQITCIKLPDSTPTITVSSVAPTQLPFLQTFIGYETEAFSNNGEIESYYEEFENVTADNVTIDTNLELYFTSNLTTNQRRWKVYMNGIKLRYKDSSTLSFPLSAGDLNVNEWTEDVSSNSFYFAYELAGDYIEVEYIKI
jgi:hypothetical protein